MLKVWWFPEYLPEEQKLFDKILNIIEQTYKSFWFYHIHTTAVEKNSVLTAKWWEEVSKQIFWLYWLAQWCKDTKKYSLHFDLTVPFARYITDNEHRLIFPFKRYQIQPVWRWERQQKWRFKEFWQADIDSIWLPKDNQDFLFFDAEIIFMWFLALYNIINQLNIKQNITIHINHKYILEWFLEELLQNSPEVDKQKIFTVIDKIYKIWKNEIVNQLKNVGLEDAQIVSLYKFITESNLYANIENSTFKKWVKQLQTVLNYLKNLWKSFDVNIHYKVDFSIVRWLDYYTWIVFETFFEDKIWWSVFSGGRYENLTSYIWWKKNYIGVWWSIWVSRLFDIIQTLMLDMTKDWVVDYMFVNFRWTFQYILDLLAEYQKSWYIVEIFPYETKLWKQLKYADKKNIKKVIILWEDELKKNIYQIKDMKTGKTEIKKLNIEKI